MVFLRSIPILDRMIDRSTEHLVNLILIQANRNWQNRNSGFTKDIVIIRDFPDHATFREKGAKLACADKLGVFLSLTLCKKANFEYLPFIK